jgi:hypothetical protein
MAPAVEGNGDKDSLSSALNDRFSLTYIPRVFQAVTIPPPFLRRTLTFEMLGKRRGKTSWWGKDAIQDTMKGDKGDIGDGLGKLFKGNYTDKQDKGQHEKNRIEEKDKGNKTGNKGKTNNDTINTINNSTSNSTSNTTSNTTTTKTTTATSTNSNSKMGRMKGGGGKTVVVKGRGSGVKNGIKNRSKVMTQGEEGRGSEAIREGVKSREGEMRQCMWWCIWGIHERRKVKILLSISYPPHFHLLPSSSPLPLRNRPLPFNESPLLHPPRLRLHLLRPDPPRSYPLPVLRPHIKSSTYQLNTPYPNALGG